MPVTAFKNLGNRFDSKIVNLGGRDYEVIKGRDLLRHVLYYTEDTAPQDIFLKTIVWVGPQSGGKTVGMSYMKYNFLTNPNYNPNYGKRPIYAKNPLYYNALKNPRLLMADIDDLRVVKDRSQAKYFEGKHVLALFKDDAIGKGTDSYGGMSLKSREQTQSYFLTRHHLEEYFNIQTGLIFFVFGVQEFKRLHPSIRRNTQLFIFTDYYMTDWFQKLFPHEATTFLREATYQGMVGFNQYAKRYCLALTQSGDIAYLEIPYLELKNIEGINIKKINTPFLSRNLSRSTIQKDLANIILYDILKKYKISMDDLTKTQIKGFIHRKKKKIEEKYDIEISNSDIVRAVEIADSLWIEQLLDGGRFKQEQREDLSISEKLERSMTYGRPIWSIQELAEHWDIDYAAVEAKLHGKTSVFKSLKKGSGYYHLKDYEPSLKEQKQYLGEEPPMLDLSELEEKREDHKDKLQSIKKRSAST
jgi:hypothetical protein